MTHRLAVLGDPVSHSRSPAMHRAGLQALGLDGDYVAIRVDRDGMADQAARMRSGDLTGANITMPHKRLAADLCDELTERAARAGAVNTWRMEGSGLLGDSTDVPGVTEAMARRSVPRRRVVVLGNGGAAAAALVALGDAQLFASGRSRQRVAALVDAVGVRAEVVDWGAPVAGATVVNATPMGMAGETLPQAVLEASAGLLDMVYGDRPTPSVAIASGELGLPVADGVDLLAAQAEVSFELWTGRRPPAGLFERIARNVSSP